MYLPHVAPYDTSARHDIHKKQLHQNVAIFFCVISKYDMNIIMFVWMQMIAGYRWRGKSKEIFLQNERSIV
jgi:hypothetical protein